MEKTEARHRLVEVDNDYFVGQMAVAHYFLKKPSAKIARRVPGLRPPAPYGPAPVQRGERDAGHNAIRIAAVTA